MNTSEIPVSLNRWLKVKYIMVVCGTHPCQTFLEYYPNDKHYSIESLSEVVYNLEKSKFIGYSCIMMTMNIACKCRLKIFRGILRAIKGNKLLRYKTKTIQMYYYLKKPHDESNVSKSLPKSKKQPLREAIPQFSHPNQCFLEGTCNISNILNTNDVIDAGIDNYVFNSANLDNMVLNQTFLEHDCRNDKPSMTILSEFEDSLQQKILTYLELDVPQAYYGYTLRNKFYELIQISTSVELYFYNINPALAIIINNYYFKGPQKTREGSDLDVGHLIRELKIKQIPYILIQDLKQLQLLEFFKYLKTKDLSALKSFLFIMMSHGNADNVVYTHDGLKLNIMEDIVAPIQANISLKEIEKLLVFVNCRGTKHAYYADYKQLKEIHDMPPTDASQLDKNTVLLFSVRQLVQSPRSTQYGTPIVQSLCKHFRKLQHEDNVTVFHGNIENDLKNVRYFRNLKLCTELVMKDLQKSSHIIKELTRASEMSKLIQSLRNEVSNSTLTSIDDEVSHDGYYNICICVNETDISRKHFISQYSDPVLDKENYITDD